MAMDTPFKSLNAALEFYRITTAQMAETGTASAPVVSLALRERVIFTRKNTAPEHTASMAICHKAMKDELERFIEDEQAILMGDNDFAKFGFSSLKVLKTLRTKLRARLTDRLVMRELIPPPEKDIKPDTPLAVVHAEDRKRCWNWCGIAAYFNVHESTIKRWFNENPKFNTIIWTFGRQIFAYEDDLEHLRLAMFKPRAQRAKDVHHV